MSKEKFTRRDALVVMSAWALGTTIVPYVAIRGPHYLSYIDGKLKDIGQDYEGEFSPYIFSTYDKDPFIIRHDRKQFRVQTNKETFSNALTMISSQEKEGISGLRKFIKLNPLNISLQDRLPEMPTVEGKYYEPVALFDGSLAGGPTAYFSKEFLTNYASRVISRSLTDQSDYDSYVYHELIHFWQDLRNPYERTYVSIYCDPLDTRESDKYFSRFCPEGVDLEKEAQEKSRQLIQKLHAGFITGKIDKSPFGHFFSFERI